MPSHSLQSPLSLAALFLLLISHTSGTIRNHTFDDTSSAFSWTSGSWTAVSAADPCHFCSAEPPLGPTFDQTYHDGSYEAGDPEKTTASFTFTGSAVYIYGLGHADDGANLVFTLGNSQTPFHYTGDNDWAYNVLYFSAENLDPSQAHTVSWILNIDLSTLRKHSFQIGFFDYAIVTSGEDNGNVPPVPSSTSPGNGLGGSEPGSSTSSSSNPTPGVNNPNHVSNTNSAGPSSSSTSPSSLSGTSSPSSSGGTDAPSSKTAVDALHGASSSATSSGTAPASDSNDSPGAGSGGGSANAPLSSTSSHNLGALIVGTVVGILILGVFGAIVFCLWHRRRRRAPRDGTSGSNSTRIGNRLIHPFSSADSERVTEKPVALSLSTVSLLNRNDRDREGDSPSPSPASTPRDADAETGSSESSWSTSPTETERSAATAGPSAPSAASEHASQTQEQPTPRERMLEDRIAQLEAQIAAPPPYV